MQQSASWLCLGDSYTIGEGVMLQDSFPYQTLALLRAADVNFHAPEIVAQTGWTTGALIEAVTKRKLEPAYDFVTLLIGVNNQYRNGSPTQYADEFEVLLQKALACCGNRPQRVTVLSIPDWGVSPFAADRDRVRITGEIDAFNTINQQITLQYQAGYIDITSGTRAARMQPEAWAPDGLHPSGSLYSEWAQKLSSHMMNTR